MDNIRKYFPHSPTQLISTHPQMVFLPEPVFEWRRKQDINFLNNSDEFRMNHKKRSMIPNSCLPNFTTHEQRTLQWFQIFLLVSIWFWKDWEKEKDSFTQWWLSVGELAVETRDFEVVFASIDENLEKNVEKAVEKHKPDVFLFSMVQWLSGIKIDFEFLKKLKANHSELLIIGDGTQYLGTEIFSFDKSALDVMAASGYKWLTAGFGNGFLMIKENARQKLKLIPQDLIPHQALNQVFRSSLYESFWTRSSGFNELRHHYAIDWILKSMGVEKCYSHIRQLSENAKSELTKLGFLQDAVVHREFHSNIFNLKGDKTLFEKLNQNQISSSPRAAESESVFIIITTKTIWTNW